MKRTSLFLPEPMLADLAAMAKQRGTPMAELVRSALEMWLAEQAWRKANPIQAENRDGTD